MKKYTEQQIKEFVAKPFFNEKTLLEKDSAFLKVSIIMTSYNQGRFLERSILSILNQNYPNLEFIIIDGGSTDESAGIIKKYEKYLAYWISEKDKGQSDGLNKGFRMATGEIIGGQNSDDIYLPGVLSAAAGFFKKNPDADIIFGNRFDIDENDNITGESKFTKFSRIVYQYDGISLGSQSTFWRKDLFAKIGYLDTGLHLAMDYEFFLRAAAKKAKFKFLPYYLGAMRRHRAAKTEMFLGTAPHQEELEKINRGYNRKKWLNLPLKIYSLAYRSVNYFLQGDGGYVFKGLARRFKKGSILSGR